MKKIILLSSLLLLGIFVSTSFALPLPDGLIHDSYLHPNDVDIGQRNEDVIGLDRDFDIFGHIWVRNRLDIYLTWSNGLNGEISGANLGDVFLYDTTGGLEYLIPLRDHDSMTTGTVYEDFEPRLSNYYFPTSNTTAYGDNEIVTGFDGTATGEFARVGWFPSQDRDDINMISLVFDDRELIGRDIRFSFTCGNDVIAPVPEPATMLLLGFGLIGLAGFGRKKFKK